MPNPLRRSSRPLPRPELDEDLIDIDSVVYDDQPETENFDNIDFDTDDLKSENFELQEEISSNKPMSDDKLKLECLKIAINVSKLANRKDVIKVADELYKFCRGNSL